MPRVFFDTTMAALQEGLDGTAARHRATANNIANIETPGYQAQVVSFESELQRALGTGNVEGAEVSTETAEASPVRLDGSAVDLETEVATLARNSLQNAALTRLLAKKIEMVKLALR